MRKERMLEVFTQAAEQAAKLAAEESFKVYGAPISAHLAWVFVNERLQVEDLILYDRLPREMPNSFYTAYHRCCAELKAAA